MTYAYFLKMIYGFYVNLISIWNWEWEIENGKRQILLERNK